MKSSLTTLLLSTALLPLALGCSKPLLVDSYTNVTTTGTNAVGGFSSDDGSCASLSSAAGSATLSLTPGSARCYYYANFPRSKPEDAIGGKRSNLSFTVAPPAPAWSFKINIKSWNGTNLVDSYYAPAGADAGPQLLSIPLASFDGPDKANLGNIRSFVFESFSSPGQEWQLGKLELLCAPATAAVATARATTMTTMVSRTATSVLAASTAAS